MEVNKRNNIPYNENNFNPGLLKIKVVSLKMDVWEIMIINGGKWKLKFT